MFLDQLRAAWEAADSLVCVGLDPDPTRFPQHLARARVHDALVAFHRAIVDATHDLVCAYKPQIAHFAALGAEAALQDLIRYVHERCDVPVILDAKRGDIGSTAERYAIEAYDRFAADAVTVNPYLGRDAVEPFLARRDRGVVVLCRTSNPGAADFQDLPVAGRPLYEHVAQAVARDWNGYGNCMLVVGATAPAQLARVRALVGEVPLLVPGVGAQGGDAAAVVRHGLAADGAGLVVSASRAVLYASSGEDFAEAARAVVERLRATLNAARQP